MPNLARNTARVAARVLAPTFLSITYASARHTRLAQVTISQPDNQVFQLHIDSNRYHTTKPATPPTNTPFKPPPA